MVWRLALSAVIVVLYNFFMALYAPVRSPIQAGVATRQVEDSPFTYGWSQLWATTDVVGTALHWVVVLLLLVIWSTALPALIRKLTTKKED